MVKLSTSSEKGAEAPRSRASRERKVVQRLNVSAGGHTSYADGTEDQYGMYENEDDLLAALVERKEREKKEKMKKLGEFVDPTVEYWKLGDAWNNKVKEVLEKIPEEVSKRYGSIMWGRATKNQPWWPCYIFHPNEVDPYTREKSLKNIAVRYDVFWYGGKAPDFEYGTVPAPKGGDTNLAENGYLRPFEEEVTKILAPPGSKYHAVVKEALAEASREAALPSASERAVAVKKAIQKEIDKIQEEIKPKPKPKKNPVIIKAKYVNPTIAGTASTPAAPNVTANAVTISKTANAATDTKTQAMLEAMCSKSTSKPDTVTISKTQANSNANAVTISKTESMAAAAAARANHPSNSSAKKPVKKNSATVKVSTMSTSLSSSSSSSSVDPRPVQSGPLLGTQGVSALLMTQKMGQLQKMDEKRQRYHMVVSRYRNNIPEIIAELKCSEMEAKGMVQRVISGKSAVEDSRYFTFEMYVRLQERVVVNAILTGTNTYSLSLDHLEAGVYDIIKQYPMTTPFKVVYHDRTPFTKMVLREIGEAAGCTWNGNDISTWNALLGSAPAQNAIKGTRIIQSKIDKYSHTSISARGLSKEALMNFAFAKHPLT